MSFSKYRRVVLMSKRRTSLIHCDELSSEKSSRNHHFIYYPNYQVTLADIATLILIILMFGNNKPRRKRKNKSSVNDSINGSTIHESYEEENDQAGSSPDLSTFAQLPLVLLGLNGSADDEPKNDEGNEEQRNEEYKIEDNESIYSDEDSDMCIINNMPDFDFNALDNLDDLDDFESDDSDFDSEYLDAKEYPHDSDDSDVKEYPNPSNLQNIKSEDEDIDDINKIKSGAEDNSCYVPASLPACIKRDYKGAKVSAILPGAYQITGEVVFNFNHVIGLKLEDKIVFVNEDSIVAFH